jgi:hypothetical protein
MGRQGPEVIPGVRSPKEAPEREQVQQSMIGLALEALQTAAAAAEPKPKTAKRCFGATARGYKLTVKVREEREVNGISIPPVYVIVSFDNGRLELDGKGKHDALIIEAIEGHRHYGRELWDEEALTARAERAAAEAFLQHVDKLPEDLQEQLRAKLTAKHGDDFELPPTGEGSGGGSAATV